MNGHVTHVNESHDISIKPLAPWLRTAPFPQKLAYVETFHARECVLLHTQISHVTRMKPLAPWLRTVPSQQFFAYDESWQTRA